MRKVKKGERYICDIYPSILNCGYRNDRIFFDWTKDGFPIVYKMKEDRQEIKEDKTLFARGSVSDEFKDSSRNERKRGTT